MPSSSLLVPPLADLLEHWIAVSVLFVFLFLALALVFARERVGSLFMGFLRILVSLVTSPFVYMERIVGKVADFGDRGDSEFKPSRLYLINKLLVVLRAVLIVSALSGLAVTLLKTWDTFRPPAELRRAESEVEERLSADQKTLAPIAAHVKALDDEWATKRQPLVDGFRKERQQRLDAATRQMASVQEAALADPQMQGPFGSIKNYLDSNSQVTPVAAVEQHYQAVVQFLDRAPVSDDSRRQLTAYADAWRTQMTSRLELAHLSEEDLRAQVQTDYREAKQQAPTLGDRVAQEQQDLDRIRQAMHYSPVAALWTLVVGLVAFLATIWLFGLIIELLSLSVHIADDVRSIRERGDTAGAKTSTRDAAPVSA